MDSLLLAARLILALVFVVAAITKLTDRRGTLSAVGNFGLPANLAAPVAMLLPFAEIVVAAALIVDRTAVWGAAGALALLAAFSIAIGVNLSRGNAVDCHCFGQLHSEPISRWTLTRNAGLIAIALFALVAGWSTSGTSSTHWFTVLDETQQIVVVLGAVTIALLGAILWAAIHLVRQAGQVLIRLKMLDPGLVVGGGASTATATAVGLPPGGPAPGFALSSLEGEIFTLESLVAGGKPVMLVFTEPNCAPCNALMPTIAHWQDAHSSQVEVAVISAGTADAAQAKAEEHGLRTVLVDGERHVALAFDVSGTPGALVIRQDATIGSPVAMGPDAIRALMDQVLELVAQAASSPQEPVIEDTAPADPIALLQAFASPFIGDPAPRPEVHALDGTLVDLAPFYDQRTIVLFYSTSCYYSRQMVPSLQTWEQSRSPDAPQLVVLATGDEEEIRRSLRLEAPVLYDPSFDIARSFGASGTPIAALVEAGGMLVTRVAGAPAIMAMLNGELEWPSPEMLAAAG